MTRDSTLDEFLREWDDGGSDAGATGGTDSGDPADGGDAAPPSDAAPAAVTCEWTPGGAACEACNATVERRWTDGDARVCADCKEW